MFWWLHVSVVMARLETGCNPRLRDSVHNYMAEIVKDYFKEIVSKWSPEMVFAVVVMLKYEIDKNNSMNAALNLAPSPTNLSLEDQWGIILERQDEIYASGYKMIRYYNIEANAPDLDAQESEFYGYPIKIYGGM